MSPPLTPSANLVMSGDFALMSMRRVLLAPSGLKVKDAALTPCHG